MKKNDIYSYRAFSLVEAIIVASLTLVIVSVIGYYHFAAKTSESRSRINVDFRNRINAFFQMLEKDFTVSGKADLINGSQFILRRSGRGSPEKTAEKTSAHVSGSGFSIPETQDLIYFFDQKSGVIQRKNGESDQSPTRFDLNSPIDRKYRLAVTFQGKAGSQGESPWISISIQLDDFQGNHIMEPIKRIFSCL